MPDPVRPPDDSTKKPPQAPGEPTARRLLRRLQPQATTPPQAAPPHAASPPPSPRPPEKPASVPFPPREHVSPFIVDNVEDIDLSPFEITPLEMADNPTEALSRLEQKMQEVTRELAEGRINQAQFQAIFTHYTEKRAVILRLMERHAPEDAVQRAAAEGGTGFLRTQHSARIVGLALFDNWSRLPVHQLGSFDLPDELLSSLLDSLSKAPPLAGAQPEARATQIEGGRWMVFVRGTFVTTVAIYSAEPSRLQQAEQARLHQEFEQVNQQALEIGYLQPDALRFPQEALFR
jgi:hypothetical protein